jgi:Glycosyl hydrolase catalytic core
MKLNTIWLADFRSEYQRLYGEWPVVEGWHVHHYASLNDYDSAVWRAKLEAVRGWMLSNGGTVELWLTEFGCLNSEAVATQVMTDQVPWLQAQSWVTRYSWYAAFAGGVGCSGCTGSLFNADGSLTTLGNLYRQLP